MALKSYSCCAMEEKRASLKADLMFFEEVNERGFSPFASREVGSAP